MNSVTKRNIKIDIIRDINTLLVKNGKKPLSTGDFDILYDLDIDQLINAQHEIFEQMRQVNVEAN